MARYRDSVCRLCRREKVKLFLKGSRCYSDKCAIERREYGPGQHGQARKSKPSDYGMQLREKQKLREYYGLLEKQFHNFFVRAEKMKGVTGDNLITLLESRFDNVVYRLGFANSRNEARSLIRQNHFLLNGKRLNIPSAIVTIGDKISVREKSKKVVRIQDALEASSRRGIPEWLAINPQSMEGEYKALPEASEIGLIVNENLIVEYYSK
jgi:small subunit ribosomal protein S4